jgi:hypothetical protein
MGSNLKFLEVGDIFPQMYDVRSTQFDLEREAPYSKTLINHLEKKEKKNQEEEEEGEKKIF